MITVKTSELTGRALDYAVAKADGRTNVIIGNGGVMVFPVHPECGLYRDYDPSSSWVFCGDLIAKYWVELMVEEVDGVDYWHASPPHLIGDYATGNTPQEAICRAVVMIEFGDTVKIPASLQEG
ncbi:DUF2591 domain-containing protein [Providencia rustigianii]|uniref:phage protein NinX family protein n=1 Tax=Providencia rustigianii TaxID=158850 RepID=UPI000F6EEB9E|nr:phage protein NinX family protein [Providencia rustigianii]MTC60372.1 DUF2591 domain-containing protein [Providencia rustigianii]VEH55044.1 Uncharacterised protein [Providencia rustigianii]